MVIDDAMRQAATAADYYMGRALADIDKRFGRGYAGLHPELVVAYMQAAATHFAALNHGWGHGWISYTSSFMSMGQPPLGGPIELPFRRASIGPGPEKQQLKE